MNWASEFRAERRTDISDISATIRETVMMEDVVHTYLPSVQTRRNRIPCPFHNGKDYNLSFSETGYKCFVCGEAGDQIKFVSSLLQISRIEAMKRMNFDLNLNLPIGEYATAAQKTHISRNVKAAKERQEAMDAYKKRYGELMAEWIRLDNIRNNAYPMSDEWCDAIKKLPTIEHLLDELEEPK